jgi:hypothetical protein
MIERKWVQDGSMGDKFKLMTNYRDNKLKINQYSSPLNTKNDNIPAGQDWSIGKLDSIQKRIKAVLG